MLLESFVKAHPEYTFPGLTIHIIYPYGCDTPITQTTRSLCLTELAGYGQRRVYVVANDINAKMVTVVYNRVTEELIQ